MKKILNSLLWGTIIGTIAVLFVGAVVGFLVVIINLRLDNKWYIGMYTLFAIVIATIQVYYNKGK